MLTFLVLWKLTKKKKESKKYVAWTIERKQ